MPRIQLLHLITRLPIGGAERLLLGILRNLDDSRFNSIVCCIQDRGELAVEVEALGIPVFSLGLMRRGRYDREVVPALRQIIRDNGIDLLHSHLYHANLYGRLAARKERIPVVASVHNTYTRRKWYRHLLNRLLARHTFVVTAGSADVERDLLDVDRLPKSKVVRLSNCIDLSRVDSRLTRTEAKERLGFSPSRRIIATVGRAEEQKGHIYLLEAFAKLLPIYDDLQLLIVGDGRLLPELKESARRLGIDAYCSFPGNISNLADVYRAIDIFVMPSLWEGLSLAMLEAMAAGLPIVATEVGGARDVLGNSEWGKLVAPGNASALATAVGHLLSVPLESAEMANQGMERVRANFSVAAMAGQLANIYVQAMTAPQ